jgi:hypothetical protein
VNNFIARVFSALLSVLHVSIALFLVLGLVSLFVFKSNLPSFFGWGPVGAVASFLIVFFLYVLIVGFLATVVSINDNLNAIKLILSSTPSQPDIPTLSRSSQETTNRLEPRV